MYRSNTLQTGPVGGLLAIHLLPVPVCTRSDDLGMFPDNSVSVSMHSLNTMWMLIVSRVVQPGCTKRVRFIPGGLAMAEQEGQARINQHAAAWFDRPLAGETERS